MKNETQWVISLLLAPAAGFLCFLLPILVAGDTASLGGPESAGMVSRVFENASPWALALLALAGFILRYFAGRGTWVLPLLLMAPFPVATAFDVITKPLSHNLLPFELAIQLACVVPPLLGAFAASLLSKGSQASAHPEVSHHD